MITEVRPERKVAELTRVNRLLLAVSFVAVALLGPAYIFGYFSGLRSSQSAAASAPPASADVPQGPPVAEKTPAKSQPPKPSARAQAVKRTAPDPPDGSAAARIYLQLAATTKDASEAMLDRLRHSGFTAVMREVPEKPGLYRVLIGPLEKQDVGPTRSALDTHGFAGAAAIRRDF